MPTSEALGLDLAGEERRKQKYCSNSLPEHLGDLVGDEQIGNRTKKVSCLLQKELSWVAAEGETVSAQPCCVILHSVGNSSWQDSLSATMFFIPGI